MNDSFFLLPTSSNAFGMVNAQFMLHKEMHTYAYVCTCDCVCGGELSA